MKTVTVNRETLRRALSTSVDGMSDAIAARSELAAVLAQPAATEGTDVPVVAYQSRETGEFYEQSYGLDSPLELVLRSDHLAALSSVIADRTHLCAAISDPAAVFVNMKRGTIAKPSLRSMIDLYGEVVNGEDAQLLEIARLRADRDRLQEEKEALESQERYREQERLAAIEEADQLRAEVEALRLDATLGSAIQRACRDLPEGFIVSVSLEKDAGTLELCLPDTDAVLDDFDGETFADQIHAAIDAARADREA